MFHTRYFLNEKKSKPQLILVYTLHVRYLDWIDHRPRYKHNQINLINCPALDYSDRMNIPGMLNDLSRFIVQHGKYS